MLHERSVNTALQSLSQSAGLAVEKLVPTRVYNSVNYAVFVLKKVLCDVFFNSIFKKVLVTFTIFIIVAAFAISLLKICLLIDFHKVRLWATWSYWVRQFLQGYSIQSSLDDPILDFIFEDNQEIFDPNNLSVSRTICPVYCYFGLPTLWLYVVLAGWLWASLSIQ